MTARLTLALLAVGIVAHLWRRGRRVAEPDPYAEPVPMTWFGCCAEPADSDVHLLCAGYSEHGWDILCHRFGEKDPDRRTWSVSTATNATTYRYTVGPTGVPSSLN